MSVTAFRIQNFMGFEDSDWIDLPAITLLFGRNSTGKSALLRALLLLRQSLSTTPEVGPLVFVTERGFDFGSYRELVRGHYTHRSMSFWFRCQFDVNQADHRNTLRSLENRWGITNSAFEVRLAYGLLQHNQRAYLRNFDIYTDRDLIFQATAPDQDKIAESPWHFASYFFDPYEYPEFTQWPFLELFTDNDFLPWLRSVDSHFEDEDSHSDLWRYADDNSSQFWSLWRRRCY